MSHLAAIAAVGGSLRFDGLFSTSGASSPVTSSTRTAVVGGVVLFDTLAGSDATPEYSKNGGAWTTITEAMTLAMANGDTLAVRAQMAIPLTETTFVISNNATGALIEPVVLSRT